MMIAKIQTCTVAGVDVQPVSVEVFMREGQLPGMLMVGLPDAAVRESKERVFAAIATSGYSLPLERITVKMLSQYFHIFRLMTPNTGSTMALRFDRSAWFVSLDCFWRWRSTTSQ
ncbi:MAG: magnesium chelatase domain-containing protein [bacterium]